VNIIHLLAVSFITLLTLLTKTFLSRFSLQTFNLDDRKTKTSLSTSVGRINKISTESSVSKASVELVTGNWNTMFETHAGNDMSFIKKNKPDELQVQLSGTLSLFENNLIP